MHPFAKRNGLLLGTWARARGYDLRAGRRIGSRRRRRTAEKIAFLYSLVVLFAIFTQRTPLIALHCMSMAPSAVYEPLIP